MRIIKEEKNMDLRAALCLFIRTPPIDFALLGRKRKYIKSKTTKANKPRPPGRGPIPIPIIATFPKPLLSRYRLRLKSLEKGVDPESDPDPHQNVTDPRHWF
jgi:hypothetical protein